MLGQHYCILRALLIQGRSVREREKKTESKKTEVCTEFGESQNLRTGGVFRAHSANSWCSSHADERVKVPFLKNITFLLCKKKSKICMIFMC